MRMFIRYEWGPSPPSPLHRRDYRDYIMDQATHIKHLEDQVMRVQEVHSSRQQATEVQVIKGKKAEAEVFCLSSCIGATERCLTFPPV